MPKHRGTAKKTQKSMKTTKKQKRFLSNLESAASIVSKSNLKIKLLHSIAYVNLSKDTFDPDNYETLSYASTPTKSSNKTPDGLVTTLESSVRRSARKHSVMIDITDDCDRSKSEIAVKRDLSKGQYLETMEKRAEDGLVDSVQNSIKIKKPGVTTHEKSTIITRNRSLEKIVDKQNLTQVSPLSSSSSSTFDTIKSPRNHRNNVKTLKLQTNKTNNVSKNDSNSDNDGVPEATESETKKNKKKNKPAVTSSDKESARTRSREKKVNKPTRMRVLSLSSSSSNSSDIIKSSTSQKNKPRTTPKSVTKKTFNAASTSGLPVDNESGSGKESEMEIEEVKSKKNNQTQTLRRSRSFTRKLNEAAREVIVLSSDSDAHEEECEAVVHAKSAQRKIMKKSTETLKKTAANGTKRKSSRSSNVQSADDDLSSDKENGTDVSTDYADNELSGAKNAVPPDQGDKQMEETDNNENEDDVSIDHTQPEPAGSKNEETLNMPISIESDVSGTHEIAQEQQDNERKEEQLMDVEDIEYFINKTINDNDVDSTEAVDGDTTLSTQELMDVLAEDDGFTANADVSMESASLTVTSVEKLEASKKVAAEATKLIKDIADYATDSDSQSGRKVTSESGSDVEVKSTKKKRPSFKLRFSKGFDYSKFDKHSCDICNMVFRTKCNREAHLLKHYDARDLTVRVIRVRLPSTYDTSRHDMEKYLHPKKKKQVTPVDVDDVKSLLTKYCKDDSILEPFESMIEGDISFSQSTIDLKSDAASIEADDEPNITILSDHTLVSGDKPEHVVEIDVNTFKAVASSAAEEESEDGKEVESGEIVEYSSQLSEIIVLNSRVTDVIDLDCEEKENDLVPDSTEKGASEVPENEENEVVTGIEKVIEDKEKVPVPENEENKVATGIEKVIENNEKDQDDNEDVIVVIPDDEDNDGKENDAEIVPGTEETEEHTRGDEKTEEKDTEEEFVSLVEAVKELSNDDQETAKEAEVIANTTKEPENITSDDPIIANPDHTKKRKLSTEDDEHYDKKQKLATDDDIVNTSHISITSDDFQSCVDITSPQPDNVSWQVESDAVPEIELRDGTVSRNSDASENENPEYLAKLAKLDKQLQAIIETNSNPKKACDDLDSTMTMNDLNNLPEDDVASEKIDESPIASKCSVTL